MAVEPQCGNEEGKNWIVELKRELSPGLSILHYRSRDPQPPMLSALSLCLHLTQETLNYWKQLSHVMKYFRPEEDPGARLPRNFVSGFLEGRN